MPSPKSGKTSNLVTPAAPRYAQEADKADPGQVQELKAQQQESGTGKYGSTPVKPFKADNSTTGPTKASWIEIQLVDEDDQPLAGESYRIALPDGSVVEGALDSSGMARVEGIDPGSCGITFPELDQDAWSPA